MEMPIPNPLHGSWIRLVFIGSKHDFAPRTNDSSEKFFDLLLGRFRVRSSVLLFQDRPSEPLGRPHRATSPEFDIVESVDKVRGAHQEIDVHGPVLAVLEGTEAVQDEGLFGGLLRAHLLMKEKAVTTETVGQSPNRGMGDPGFPGNLAESGAGDEAVEHGFKEIVSAEPVVGGEGL